MTATVESPTPAREIKSPDHYPFEPLGVRSRYAPPPGMIDPDTSKGWLKRIFPVVKAHRRVVLLSCFAALFAMSAQVAIPAVTRLAIDNALTDQTAALAPYIWALVGLAVVRAVTTFTYRDGLYRTAYDIEYDLRNLIYEHLTRLSFSFFDRVQSGQVISRANSDIRTVQMFLGFAPFMAMAVISFFVAFGYMLTIHVPLAILAVAPLPFVYFLGVGMRNVVFPVSWIAQARVADVATIVDENVNGVRVVKAFAQEEEQLTLLAKAAQKLRWASVVMIETRAKYGPVMENLPRVGLGAVLLYGGWLAIDGQVSIGTIVAFNAYVVMLQMPFRILGFFLIMGQRAKASAERIFEILDEQPTVTDRPGALDLVDPDGRVSFSNVQFRYGADHPDAAESTESTESTESELVLDGFDLTIEPGETVAIVGRTGSGKSTLARLLTRFYDVTDGSVEIDGHDVRDLTVTSLRAAVGVVLDEPFLFSASIYDNIAYGRPDASLDLVVEAAKAANAHDFITDLAEGYDSVIGERGYTLSGGQRQRIAIARTLLVNPKVLVLDDATSAIDVRVESEIHDALTTLMQNRTTIVIAQRLSTIVLARRVVLLEAGKVMATGTHAELMATQPAYAQVLARTEATAVSGPVAESLPIPEGHPVAQGAPPPGCPAHAGGTSPGEVG